MVSYLVNLNTVIFLSIVLIILRSKDEGLTYFYFLFSSFLFGLILYHLNNPHPYDLQVYWSIYKNITRDPGLLEFLVKRDPVGYGSMALLAKLLPNYPETYYLLNIALWGAALLLIFKEVLKTFFLSAFGKVIVFIFLFFLLFDLDDLHHSMRHSIACSLVALSLVRIEKNRAYSVLLFVFAVLWQGSLIMFMPMLFIRSKEFTKKKTFIISVLILILGFLISNINTHNLIEINSIIAKILGEYFPRLYWFLINPDKAKMFELNKELGHPPFWMIEVPLFLLTFTLINLPRFYNHFLVILLSSSFFYVIAFRFNFAMILRLENTFELCARSIFLWIIIQLLNKKDKLLKS